MSTNLYAFMYYTRVCRRNTRNLHQL